MDVSDPKSIGLRIKQLREARGFTQEDIAAMLGVSVDSVAQWEQGIGITLSVLRALARALSVKFESLVVKSGDVLQTLTSLGVEAMYLSDITNLRGKRNSLQRISPLVLTSLPDNPDLFKMLSSNNVSNFLALPDLLVWAKDVEGVKPFVRYVWITLESTEYSLGITYQKKWTLVAISKDVQRSLKIDAGVVALIF